MNKRYEIRRIAIVIAVYVCLATLYFLPLELPFKLVYPVAFMAMVSVVLLPWEMSVAFLMCAVGDYVGQTNVFVAQMVAFALGHVLFIIYYIRYWNVWDGKKMQPTVLILVLGLFAWADITIASYVTQSVIRMGIYIYMALILAMAYMACRQTTLELGVGAVLFVVSDAVLAFNKFVSPINDAGTIIMLTYYAAQLFLFVGARKHCLRR